MLDYDVTPCASDPCMNNAQCTEVQTGSKYTYRCHCAANYTGIDCESGNITDLYKYSIQIPYLLFTPYHIM